MKPTEDHREPPAQRGFLSRFRALPGSRTAVVAFVLTIALGVGGTAAYAWWSQTGRADISVTAGAPIQTTPPPTTAPPTPAPGGPTVIAPNVKTAWAGKPAEPTCARVQTDTGTKTIGIKFSWPNLSTATSYVVSVKSQNVNYTYTQPAQEVRSPQATFIFPEDKLTPNAAFYADYLVRIMPMKGSVGGDPVYQTFQHRPNELNNCYYSGAVNSPIATTTLTCTLGELRDGPNDEVNLRWTAAAGASSYRVSVRPKNAGSTYGADLVTSSTSTTFRFDVPAHVGVYVLRVQPMNGSTAGDPAYVTYDLRGPWSHSCGGWGDTFQ